jgi:hypothetical protein
MKLRTVHLQNIRNNMVRPLCERAGVRCRWGNSSPSRHEVTCKMCLKRMMAVKLASETDIPKPTMEAHP